MTPYGTGAASVEPVPFSALQGWRRTDFAAAWRTLWLSANSAVAGIQSLRPAVAPDALLLRIFEDVAREHEAVDEHTSRALFERHFTPHDIVPEHGEGFITGYYEPVVDGSVTHTTAFTAPILPRPEDLITGPLGKDVPGLPAGFAAGRATAAGLEPYPDRAALEAYAISPEARPLLWLRDWTEVFLVQVQGSARVRLTDGTECRLVYAGRNGHPYTSIGRILSDTGEIASDRMSLAALKQWLRDHGQAPGDEGRQLMHRNASYIFFRAEPVGSAPGPTGGAGLPLTPMRSIATDRAIWPYGLPFWINTDEAVPGFDGPLNRLFIGQDTGSAIVGPARADLFLGSGDEAGRAAGSIRHPARFTVLLPRAP